MNPHFTYQENPNNIVIIPTVAIAHNGDKIIYTLEGTRETSSLLVDDQIYANNMSFEVEGDHIPEDNSESFCSGSQWTTYFNDEQYVPIEFGAEHKAIPPCSNYNYYRYLVELPKNEIMSTPVTAERSLDYNKTVTSKNKEVNTINKKKKTKNLKIFEYQKSENDITSSSPTSVDSIAALNKQEKDVKTIIKKKVTKFDDQIFENEITSSTMSKSRECNKVVNNKKENNVKSTSKKEGTKHSTKCVTPKTKKDITSLSSASRSSLGYSKEVNNRNKESKSIIKEARDNLADSSIKNLEKEIACSSTTPRNSLDYNKKVVSCVYKVKETNTFEGVDTKSSSNLSSNNMKSFTKSKIENKLKCSNNVIIKKDPKLYAVDSVIKDSKVRSKEPNSSRSNIYKEDKNRKNIETKTTTENNKQGYFTEIYFESKSPVFPKLNRHMNDISENSRIRKVNFTGKDMQCSFKQTYPPESTKTIHEELDYNLLHKSEIFNKEPGACKRYLAYQRFLRKYYKKKSQIEEYGKDIEDRKKFNDKIIKTGRKAKYEEFKVETVDNINLTKMKEWLTTNVNCKMDEETTKRKINENKKNRNAYKHKMDTHEGRKKKKKELKEKLDKYFALKKNIANKKKTASDLDNITKKQESIESTRYTVQNKKSYKENTAKLCSSGKGKQDSNSKLYRYVEQNMSMDDTKKAINIQVNRMKKNKVSKEKLSSYIEHKKRKELKDRKNDLVERKKKKAALEGKLVRRLERKEMKKVMADKIARYLEKKRKYTKLLKSKVEEKKVTQRPKYKRIKNVEHQDSEEDEIQSVNRRYNNINNSTPRSAERKTKLKYKRIKTVEHQDSEEDEIKSEHRRYQIEKIIPRSSERKINKVIAVNDEKNKRSLVLLRKPKVDLDLRTILSRKRTTSQNYGEAKRIKSGLISRENILITVKQDVNTQPEPVKIKQTKTESKVNESKNIKLVINIVCSNSGDSADSNLPGNVSPQEDLSFLDDFDVDEIVNSLNVAIPIQESNKTKKGVEETNNSINAFNTSQEVFIKINSENNVKTLSVKKGDPKESSSNASSRCGDCEIKINCTNAINEEKHNANPHINASEPNMNAIVKVIDTCHNVKSNIIVGKDNGVDSFLTDQHDDEQKTKLNDLGNLQKDEEKILINDNINDKIESSNKLHTTIDLVFEDTNIDDKLNITPSAEKTIANMNNIDDKTFIEIENMLSKITHSNMENITSNASIKVNNSNRPTISVEESPIFIFNIGEEIKNNIVKAESSMKYEDSTESSNVTAFECEAETTTPDSQNTREHSAVSDKTLTRAINEAKTEYKTSSLKQMEVSTQKKNINPTKAVTLDTKSDASTVVNLQNTKRVAKVTNIITAVKKPATSKNNQENNQNSNIISAVQSAPCEKSISNVVENKQTVQVYNRYLSTKIIIQNTVFKRLNRRIFITTLIHSGQYSWIYKCNNIAGETYAIKVIKKSILKYPSLDAKVLMDIQGKIPSHNYCIVEIIDSLTLSSQYCYITNYYSQSLDDVLNLKNYKKWLSIDLVQILTRQLVAAVVTLTMNNIIHLEISPRHILLNETIDRLKLCGFDQANFKDNICITPCSGEVNYRAPEIILGYEADHTVDVWALALVLHEMFTGDKTFTGRNNNEILYQQISSLGPLEYDMLEHCSLRDMHFSDMAFKRYISANHWNFISCFEENNNIESKLYEAYYRHWKRYRDPVQVCNDLEKIKKLHNLLQHMLVMDPRKRVLACYIGTHDFVTLT